MTDATAAETRITSSKSCCEQRARDRRRSTGGRHGWAYFHPVQDREGPDRLTLAAFGGAVLIGGSNFVGVKFSNAELAPMYGAAARFTAAAVIFLLLAWALSLPLPRGRAMLGAALYGALGFGVAYGFMYFALIEISIGTASVIMATVPLFTLAFAVLHGQERFTVRGIIAGILALAGIGVMSVHSLNADAPLVHLLAGVVAACAIAEATVVVKGFPRADPVTTNAVGAVAGSLLLWVASIVAGESWILPEQGRTWAAFAWLATVGSIGLLYLILFVVGRWTASASVYVLTLMPVVAVALGALLADEAITPEVVGGTALVLLAVYVGAIRRSIPSARIQT